MPSISRLPTGHSPGIRARSLQKSPDLLLKPFDDARFLEALKRVKKQVKMERVSRLSRKLIELLAEGGDPRSLAAPGEAAAKAKAPEPARRLAIKDTGRVVFLDVEDIDWIESADYYVQLHVGPKVYLHRETMQSLEGRLDPKRYVRIHRTAIVNRDRVKELHHEGRRDLIAVLSTGVELRVSRSCREKIEQLT